MPTAPLVLRMLGVSALLSAAACRVERAPSGRPPSATRTLVDSLTRVEQDSVSADAVRAALRTYYQRLSRRDWLLYAQSFWHGATIVTRATPEGEREPRVSMTGVDDFARRAGQEPRLAVFGVDLVEAEVHTYGDLAQAWVVYRSRSGRTRAEVATHYGVDGFNLLRQAGEWRIVSLAFTNEDPARPLAVQRP